MTHEASKDNKAREGAVGDDRGVVQHTRQMIDSLVICPGEVESIQGYPATLRLIEAIGEVATLTPALVEIGDVFNILYDTVIFATFTATDTTVANVTAGLAAAWTAATAAWVVDNPGGGGPDRITATDDTTEVTLTFDTDGIPFAQRITTSTVDGGGADTQTLTKAITANNDTSFVAEDSTHMLGTKSTKFSKINGSNDSVFAGFAMTALDFDLSRFTADAVIESYFMVTSKVNIVGIRLDIGTDENNYNSWELLVGQITANIWQEVEQQLSEMEATVVGDGWDQSAVKYAAFNMEFTLAANTLADVLFDHVSIHAPLS